MSEFYLHHRLSEDLDFFTEGEFSEREIDDFIARICRKLDISTKKETHMGHIAHYLQFKNSGPLKIDFVHQPFKQLEHGMYWNKLRVASLWDITIDKVYTIFNRVASRDFVDLYFTIQKEKYNWNQIIDALEEKYQAHFDRMSLMTRFPVVKDVQDFPTMLVSFDRKRMEEYFLHEVKKMEGEIFQ